MRLSRAYRVYAVVSFPRRGWFEGLWVRSKCLPGCPGWSKAPLCHWWEPKGLRLGLLCAPLVTDTVSSEGRLVLRVSSRCKEPWRLLSQGACGGAFRGLLRTYGILAAPAAFRSAGCSGAQSPVRAGLCA